MLLVYRTIPSLEGQYVGPGSTFSAFGSLLDAATEEGAWDTDRGINPVTKQEEPRRILAVLHDGLVFAAGHSALPEDVENSTKEYVNKAIAKYEEDGLDAVIAHYNSQDSLDGQFYLFLIGADDNYLAHPIFPHLIGTDIKAVVGSDGQELGREIAQATEQGIWVEYLWPHPVSRKEQQKVTWAVRHDGLIFSSGYYAGGPESGAPPWQDADPKDYTVDYVERAVERYEREGLESMLNYYNSVASFEGEWYLFATGADDVYHVHPLLPRLIGTDIKNVVGSDGYELGKELAKAKDGGKGVWVEYLWPHPVTLKEVPKVGYAVRHDGMLFASGYYVHEEDPAAETKAYVQKAIDYYRENGLDATIAHYNSEDSVDGQWNLSLADEDDIVLVALLTPRLIGSDLKDLGAASGLRRVGQELAAATEEGLWVSFIFPNTRSSETLYAHAWAIRHDGLLFMSRYYDDRPEVPEPTPAPTPEPEPDDDALTRAYVEKAVAYYEANGREATIERYSDPSSREGERQLDLLDAETYIVLASAVNHLIGNKFDSHAPGGPFHGEIELAGEEGRWLDGLLPNHAAGGQQEPARIFIMVRDGLVFRARHFVVVENVADTTKEYVNRAIQYYDDNGLDATVAHYNSRASMDGQFYLFMMDENDIYLVHPFLPRLIGTDLKAVTSSDNPQLGREIAQATEEGIWFEYRWPNPVSLNEESKVTWAIRHDGKIFASGYYAGREDPETPPWVDADPIEYTVEYVNRAIERYEEFGLESVKAYYNSVASFEGEWYLFATDASDIYVIHPVFSRLIGTDIKDVASSDGYELGKEIAKATEEGHWIEYPWPHPITEAETPKVSYAKRHDGYIFASGYYPLPDDPEGYTRSYVQKAIDMYERKGLEATAAHYNSFESMDGQWYMVIIGEDGKTLADARLPGHVGKDAEDFVTSDGFNVGEAMLKATGDGYWFQRSFATPETSGEIQMNIWAIRHDGLVFSSGYFGTQPSVPTDDELTRAYVAAAIEYYEANGREATAAHYNSPESFEGERLLMLAEPVEAGGILATVLTWPLQLAVVGATVPIPELRTTEEILWFDGQHLTNPVSGQREPARILSVRHDGLVFISAHFVLRENVEDATKNYVNKAIALYDSQGRDAVIARYNSRDSLDGQFYLFLIGADDNYLAHPIFPHLIGTDIKDVEGSDGQELGKEIAEATEAGIWVEYLWPNPVTQREEPKVTWSIRHDGLIFSSGYYTGEADTGPPPWQGADPRAVHRGLREPRHRTLRKRWLGGDDCLLQQRRGLRG